MDAFIKKTGYLERKRQAILDLGYDYIKFRSRTRKSLAQLKRMIINNACHFESASD